MDLSTHGEDLHNVKFDYAQMRRMANSIASEAMEEQRKCLAKDPSEWCNRDLRYEDHYRGAYSRLVSKHKFEYADGTTNRQNRNQWLLILFVAFTVLTFQVRGLMRGGNEKRTEPAA
jgi:hypothetical protein